MTGCNYWSYCITPYKNIWVGVKVAGSRCCCSFLQTIWWLFYSRCLSRHKSGFEPAASRLWDCSADLPHPPKGSLKTKALYFHQFQTACFLLISYDFNRTEIIYYIKWSKVKYVLTWKLETYSMFQSVWTGIYLKQATAWALELKKVTLCKIVLSN